MAREALRIQLSLAEEHHLQKLAGLTARPRPWSCVHGLFFAAANRTSPVTITLPRNWDATATRSASGGDASSLNVSRDFAIFLARVPPELFPPEDRQKVLVLATTVAEQVDVPVSHWSLDDLALKILDDAHYQDISRSTIQRILSGGELKPHKVRSWLHCDDPDFEPKALDICGLYLQAPQMFERGELVLCTDEKTCIQALERKHPGKPMKSGQPEKREF